MSYSFSPKIITEGLVLYLDAANTKSYSTGTTWRDLSRGDNNGTLINGPTFNSANGGSIVFDGVDDYVDFGNVLNLGTNSMTINAWVKINSSVTNKSILTKTLAGLQNYSYQFRILNNNTLSAFFQGNGGADITPSSVESLENDRWYMCTVTFNRSSNINFYLDANLLTINGNNVISQWNNLNFQSTNPLRVGSSTAADNVGLSNLFNGNISLMQVYFRTLSQQEILQNFNATRARYGITEGLSEEVDADALAFILAAGINDTTQRLAIFQLVSDLKEFGIWIKMQAIYPFVGGTAQTHKFNLKDPRDSNEAFRLGFSGGWTHTSTGALPNGTNAFANTYYIQNTNLPDINNHHVSIYSRTNINQSAAVEMGVRDAFTGALTRTQIVISRNGLSYTNILDDTFQTYSDSNSLGNVIINRTSSTSINCFRNSSLAFSASVTSVRKSTRPIYLGCANVDTVAANFSSKEIAFSSIGQGLTNIESVNYYTAIQKFQTTLNRQV